MLRTLCKDLGEKKDQKVMVQGWVHRIRDLGGIVFVILRDRSGQVQLVFDEEVEEKPAWTHETVIQVQGQVLANEKALGGIEIRPTEIQVLGIADPDLPLPVNQDPSKYNIDSLLDHRLISLRMPKVRAIFQIQSAILGYLGEYMRSQEFSEIKTSKLIGSGTEGGTGLFEVEYFEDKVYLAQSPQFYKQAMVSSGLERVFEISHAYRAEKHDTPRHLNEYVSFDVEMAFIQDEFDLMELEKGILAYVFEKLQENQKEELDLWEATVPDPESVKNIPVLGHDEAKKIISARVGRRVFEINPEGERVLCEWAQEEHGIDMVFINDWPRRKRPFYTYPKGIKTMSFDLIFRGLEITTGGRRINEYEMLQMSLPKFGLTEEGLGGYCDIFKYGCPPHGGFAIGVERLTQKILGLANVKEASPFPRDRKRITP